MSTRLDALAELLDAPLLVTNLTNIFYLTGFDASNAGLYVKPGGERRSTRTSGTRNPPAASPASTWRSRSARCSPTSVGG